MSGVSTEREDWMCGAKGTETHYSGFAQFLPRDSIADYLQDGALTVQCLVGIRERRFDDL